ncbi:ABC transporter permease [Neorhizobium sp. NCHU2750]|uniref:ABC transporter permease n=1 Tax=Neorhizobium sp. NCHU2750 TaxID=1825976 RepID=UPI000EB752C2|nr:peptide/nickel ABC transporter permease [Neorhizobium sp. NCHU2750]
MTSSIVAKPAASTFSFSPKKLAFLLIAVIWASLVAFVMFRAEIGGWDRYVLIPAIPAAIIVYAMAIYAWRESTIAMVGVTLVMFWILMAVTAPYLPILDPNKPIAPYALPGTVKRGVTFILGTDMRGRDILSRTIWGCQRVIVWGITATAVAYVVGAAFGLIAGYLGGLWDEAVSFVGNVLLSFPVMILFILVVNFLGQSGFNIVIAVTCSSAPAIMRIVRGLALDAKTRDYIQAAQTRGEHSIWIMLVELLPNVRGPIIVDACLRLGYTTVAITTLTFLGLGLQPPDPDWGLMIKEASSSALLWKFSYMLVVPAVSVTSLILGFNLMADGLREMSLRD